MTWRERASETLVTMLAVALTVVVAVALDPAPGAAVMGGMLALTLSRSQLERDARGRLEAAAALPVIGVIAALIGGLLAGAPVVGAAVYTLALAGSVWVRRFGQTWTRLGALLVLPLTAVLVAPIAPATAGPLAAVGWLVPILVPLIAFAWVTVIQLGARRAGLLPPAAAPSRPRGAASASTAAARRRLRPSDRMAIQLALALALAFAVGFVFFPTRWAWLVLTVVILLVGTAGRADVAVKGAQRLAGAGLGSVVAFCALGAEAALPIGWRIGLAALALAAGVFLRRAAYIWWALLFTIALSLVQSLGVAADGSGGGFLLGQRLFEIAVGAVIAVAVGWSVLPVPTVRVIQKRMLEVRDAARPPGGAAPSPRAIGVAKQRLRNAAEPYLMLDRVGMVPPRQRELIDRVKAILG